MNAYAAIDRHHEAELVSFARHADWLESRSTELTERFWREYLETGRIDVFDWSIHDLEALSAETGKGFKDLVNDEVLKLIASAEHAHGRYRIANLQHAREVLGDEYEAMK